MVLVVGETTRAANWGLNGYSRQTTPLLAARDEIVNFPQVRSCGTSTARTPAVYVLNASTAWIMTKSKPNTRQPAGHRAARKRGSYLVGKRFSGCKGVCGKVPNTDVTSLNLPEYCRNGECLDNILLTKFGKSSTKTIKVRFNPAYHRQPRAERITNAIPPKPNANSRRPATPTKSTNAPAPRWSHFDNTVLYVDQFIDKVIRKLENRDDLESVVHCVSDHGESLGENRMYLHAAPPSRPFGQTHIPMVMWFSNLPPTQGHRFQCLKQKKAARKTNIRTTTISARY